MANLNPRNARRNAGRNRGGALVEGARFDIAAGQLTRLPSLELRREHNVGWYSGQLFARDQRAFEIHDNTLTAIDTSSRAAPTTLSQEIPGWTCQSLEVAGSAAYCALGQRGVEVIDLSPLAPAASIR